MTFGYSFRERFESRIFGAVSTRVQLLCVCVEHLQRCDTSNIHLPCVLVNLLACFMCLNASWLTFILAILTGGFWPACVFGVCCFLAWLPCFVQKVEKLLLKKDPWPLFRSSIGRTLIFVQLYHYCKKHIFPNIVQTTWVELKCAAGAGKHCIHVHIYIYICGYWVKSGPHGTAFINCTCMFEGYIYPVPIYTKDILNHTCFHPWQPSHLKHEPTNVQTMSTHICTHIWFLSKR